MSGGYVGYGPAVVPGAKPAAIRLVAAGLLVAVAALAIGGSIATLWVNTFTSSTVDGSVNVMTNGWYTVHDDPDSPQASVSPLFGVTLTVGALLALAAAVMLFSTGRRPDDPAAPRLIGVVASGFLLGTIGTIWLVLASYLSYNSVLGASFQNRYSVGVGGWVLLVAAVVALVVVVLLLVPRRKPLATLYGAGSGSGYGAGPGYPPGPAPGWAPPQAAPPGWAGPPPAYPPAGYGAGPGHSHGPASEWAQPNNAPPASAGSAPAGPPTDVGQQAQAAPSQSPPSEGEQPSGPPTEIPANPQPPNS